MRILQLVNSLDFGGTERLVVDLATALQSRGHRLHVVCLRNRGNLAEMLERAGVEVYALDKAEGPSVQTLWRFVGYLKRQHIEVIHTHNPLVHHYGVLGGRLAGIRAVVNTIHGIGNLSASPGFKEFLYSRMCRLSSRIVAVCPMAHRTFAKGGVIPTPKLIAINNGIHVESFLGVEPAAAQPGAVFGIVGRLVPVKNHRSLLEAFAAVLPTHPDSRLEILGDGPLRAALEQRVSELGIAERVTFRGYGSDVSGFMRDIDIAVLCSDSEGLPLSVLEAMASGLPVVGTDVGGMRDLIEGGECGWICPPGSVTALASALLAAASTKTSERRAMGERGRAHVAEHYSLERMTVEYEQLFTEILAEHPLG
jgi:glycosyltransferase involved in cell wall biosynthesis